MGPFGEPELDAMHAVAHDTVPIPGSAYIIGPERAGRIADLRNALDYPAEAVCRCGGRIVCLRLVGGEWRHEDRS